MQSNLNLMLKMNTQKDIRHINENFNNLKIMIKIILKPKMPQLILY